MRSATNRQRRWGLAMAGVACAPLLVGALAMRARAQATGSTADADRRCLECHGQAHIGELGPEERRSMVGTWLDSTPRPEDAITDAPLTGDEPPTRPGLYVTREHLASSVHSGISCVECHEDAARLPHAPNLNLSTCATACHADPSAAFLSSTHMDALTRGDELAPGCSSCHGGHDILPVTAREAPQHRLNSLFLCGDCHQQHRSDPDRRHPTASVTTFLESAHARAATKAGLLWAATCADCHDAHAVHHSDDPRSTVYRTNVPATCGACHLGVNEVYADSVHGRLLAENDERAPVCTDCHTAHGITRATSPDFIYDIINECGSCHDTPPNNGDRVGTYYETYLKSYHGQVTTLGSKRAARCSDCHGAHDILPGDDPESRVNEAHLVETCRACHPGANASFVQFDPHANYRDAKNYPVLYAIWWYFLIVMSTVFGFFGLHCLLWLVRSRFGKKHHAPASDEAPPKTAIRRFTGLNRVNHALVVITFFGLTATGIPLVFSHQAWSRTLAGLFGGIEAAGTWHRVFAVMLIVNFILHFIGLGRSFARRSGSWRTWLFGPESMVPRWKDVADCFGMLRWFFGAGRKPSFGRWAYWEKFDYWAEVFGSFIIGGTGLLLWFPETASLILPGWVFNIAMVVHGYEALLAIGFIFTIHFFNAHLRPGTFPVDEVIFTGSVPEDELKEQRPEEYKRLVESGRLESRRVAAPDPARRPLHVVLAVLLVGIGLILLALIITGGLGLL